jgi:hypothetical protein
MRTDIDVRAHETLTIETEFGTTLITIVPHISGMPKYRLRIEYVPYTLTDGESLLPIRRN